mmetsp:Transcript_46123/g.105106  ORF Transcript_46123/g.105106 Transcript_46123/m.105106 type:complete len:86 (+) Transcript_46123:3-260(+)
MRTLPLALLYVLLAAHAASPEMPFTTASLGNSAMPRGFLQLLAAQNVGKHAGRAGRWELRGGRDSSEEGSAEEEKGEGNGEEEEE